MGEPTEQGAAPAKSRKPVAMLLYPGFAGLDLTGPNSFLAMHGDVRFVAKSMRPVRSSDGLVLTPITTLARCPLDLEILLVPGGREGTLAAMRDRETLDFLRARADRTDHLASVCTGAGLLGAAGLLRGKRATANWLMRDLLPLFGAIPVEKRVVRDGQTWTAAGVTAGLDLGVTLVAELFGEHHARVMELAQEYDPHPPFAAGTPALAGPELTAEVLARAAPFREGVREIAARSRS